MGGIDARKIRLRIHDLIDEHCSECTKKRGQDELYCVRECSIGQQIHELGKQLVVDDDQTKTTGKEEKAVGKPAQNQVAKEELTREKYLQLKEKGFTDTEIRERFGIGSQATLTRWKKRIGVIDVRLSPSGDPRLLVREETESPDSGPRHAMEELLRGGKTAVFSRADFLRLVEALEALGISWVAAGDGTTYTVRTQEGDVA